MPKNEMSKMLADLGAPVPQFADPNAAPPPSAKAKSSANVTAAPARSMEKPPFRGEFGQEIYENTCANCWKEAIAFGTKVINELRLPLSDPQAQKAWDQHIREFLNLK